MQCGADHFARGIDSAHEFDDDVDVVACHECRGVVGDQFLSDLAWSSQITHRDAAQFNGRTDPSPQVGGVVLEDSHDLGTHIAHTEDRDADRLVLRCHALSRRLVLPYRVALSC